MRVLRFLGISVVYGTIATFIWFQLLLSCGLGPDSSERCNATADHNAAIFTGIALIIYGLFVTLYWRGRRTGVR